MCRCVLTLPQLGVILALCLLPIIHLSWSLPAIPRTFESECVTDPGSKVDMTLHNFLSEHVRRTHDARRSFWQHNNNHSEHRRHEPPEGDESHVNVSHGGGKTAGGGSRWWERSWWDRRGDDRGAESWGR
jgi:hypothetical protein